MDNFVKFWSDLFARIGDWFVGIPPGQQFSNLERIIYALIVLVGGHYLIKLIMMLVRKLAGVKKGVQVDVSAKQFTISVISIALNILIVFYALSVLNFDFSSLASILSAATVAVGLALQNLISSFASGIILLNSKYFVTGDYIALNHSDGNVEGYVVRVALISTQLRTFDGQLIVIPNEKLTKGVITNYTKEENRRGVIKFYMDYSADYDAIKEIINNVLLEDKRIKSNPAIFIHIDELTEQNVVVKVKYWTKYEDYWDTLFDSTERIFKTLKDNKVKIPYTNVRLQQEQK